MEGGDNAKSKEKNENLKFLSWQSERLAYVQKRINNPGRGGRCKSKRQLYACNTKKLLLLELYGSFLFRFHNVDDLISQKFKYNIFF